ncbi:MAG: hypothetical protein JNM08_04880, partial [Rubrivivax sp.]|nr:hypothetical protein [Rubrivivax sp.]
MIEVRAPIGGLSHVRGTTDEALVDTTVFDLLADTAARHPQRDAAVFCEQGRRYT